MANDEKTARFLDDAPCHEESAFQVHEKISQAIVQEIIHEAPGNIALIGHWGSGKSTVIERIRHLLEEHARSGEGTNGSKEKSHIYFVFDAWAHSGDSLRRSFLDMLLMEISDEDGLDAATVKHNQDKIYGKVSSSTVREKTSFAPIVAAGIVAIASYAVSEGFLRGALPLIWHIAVALGFLEINDPTGFLYWTDAVAMLLAIFAFLLMLVAYRFSTAGKERAKKKKKKKERKSKVDKDRELNKSQKSFFDWFSGSVAAIFSKQADATTTLVRQDNSPVLDSVEFEKLFQEILGLTNKNVTIVFDNLDRLDKRSLREAWDTLQIFANPVDIPISANKRPNRPWILLPVSLEVFQAVENFTPKTETLSISKAFIRSFEIPTPIVTDWKDYFLKLAQQAFPTTDESILLNVYAIASHSLLRTESRTPRNAKRFINSMVSQSLVFPEISLVSIAAFCYAKDSYTINAVRTQNTSHDDASSSSTFSSYMLDLISGKTPEAQYLGFPSGHVEGLDRDLAMMTYGQFSPEKASEVYVSLQMNRLFRDEDQVDFGRLVKNNSGAWELIAKEVEDELWSRPLPTPRWVFITLAALHALDEETQQADSAEIGHLAQILIGGIVSLNDQGSQGCGAIIANYMTSCSLSVVEELIESTIEELKNLVSEVNQAIEEGSTTKEQHARNALKRYLGESIPVLEEGYRYSTTIKNRLENGMLDIDFGKTYREFLSYALSLKGNPKWIKAHPPQTIDEFSQLFEMLADAVDSDDFHSPVINVTNEIGLLDEFELNAEELESLVSTLANHEGGLGALDVKLWLMIKICGLEAKIVVDLFGSVRSSISALRDYAEEGDVHRQAAALSMILNHYSNDEFTESDITFISSLCNAEVISFLVEHGIDLIPQLLKLLNSDESPLKAPCDKLLRVLWTPDDYAKRDKEEFFTLIAVKSRTDERKEQGRLFAKSGRVNELIEKGFNIWWFSVYLGALEGLKERNQDKETFSDWIVDNLRAMNIKEWKDAIQSTMARSLISVMSETAENIQLPQLDKTIGQEAGGYPSENISGILIDLLGVYNSNLAYVAGCITNRIIASQNQISVYVQSYGALLTCCKWLSSLTAEQRYFVTEAIITTRRTHDCEWLYKELNAESNPKSLYRGFIKKTKSLIIEQIGYKTMRKGAKEACENILELLK